MIIWIYVALKGFKQYIKQGLAIYDPQAKPATFFVNNILLEHCHAPSFTHHLLLLLHNGKVEEL